MLGLGYLSVEATSTFWWSFTQDIKIKHIFRILSEDILEFGDFSAYR